MICIKFDQKNKKNLNFGLLRFFEVFKKKLKFFEAIFQPWSQYELWNSYVVWVEDLWTVVQAQTLVIQSPLKIYSKLWNSSNSWKSLLCCCW